MHIMYTNAEKLASYQVSQPQLEEHCTPRGYTNSLSLTINRWLLLSQRGNAYPATSNDVQLNNSICSVRHRPRMYVGGLCGSTCMF